MTYVTSKKSVAIILISLIVMFLYLGFLHEKNKGKEALSESNKIELTENNTDKIESIEKGLGEGQVTDKSNNLSVSKDLENIQNKMNNLNSENFFVEYRLERDRQRGKLIELLQTNIINNQNSSLDVRNEAQQKIISMSNTLEQELKLETLIKAKGYKDAVLFIQPSSILVIVRSDNLSSLDAEKIADLVAQTTSQSLEKITIVPKA